MHYQCKLIRIPVIKVELNFSPEHLLPLIIYHLSPDELSEFCDQLQAYTFPLRQHPFSTAQCSASSKGEKHSEHE